MDDQPEESRVLRNRIIVLFDVSDTLFSSETGELLPGARELIEALHCERIKMGIASDSYTFRIKSLLITNGLAAFFPVIVGRNNSTLETERYRQALAQFNTGSHGKKVHRPEVFVIDDRMSRMEAARILGFKFLAVATGSSSASAFETGSIRPYRIFKDLTETKEIVKAIIGDRTSQRKEKGKA